MFSLNLLKSLTVRERNLLCVQKQFVRDISSSVVLMVVGKGGYLEGVGKARP